MNAHRVGFGSDTITTADGTIRSVKQGDKVSREDAERDLQRRTLESLAQVERAIGKDAFDKLSPNQQAALASVTYNYGTLPQRIEGAARSGNVETLARAIESLSGDNGGVNANRRRYEAQLARLPDSNRGAQLAGLLDEDTRSSMLSRAEEEDRQLTLRAERETQSEQRRMLADVKRRIDDDVSSMEGSGQGLPGLRREEIAQAAGEEVAREWEEDRKRSRRVFEALEGIRELTEPEIMKRLQSLEPGAGTDGYLEDAKAYERARKKADEFLNLRRTDPALEVDKGIPIVRQAWAAAEYEGEGDSRRMKPESRRAITRARITAQRELGIENPMAVTKAEAAVLARELRYIGEDNKPALDRFNRQVQSQYGDFTDEVISSVLQMENVNRDLAVVETELVRRLGSGSGPDPELARRVDTARQAAALIDAMNGKTPPETRDLSTFSRAPAANSAGNVRRATASQFGGKPAQTAQAAAPSVLVSTADMQTIIDGKMDPTQFAITYQMDGPAAQKLITNIQKRAAELLGPREGR